MFTWLIVTVWQPCFFPFHGDICHSHSGHLISTIQTLGTTRALHVHMYTSRCTHLNGLGWFQVQGLCSGRHNLIRHYRRVKRGTIVSHKRLSADPPTLPFPLRWENASREMLTTVAFDCAWTETTQHTFSTPVTILKKQHTPWAAASMAQPPQQTMPFWRRG